MNAIDSLKKLQQGNERFVRNSTQLNPSDNQLTRQEQLAGQSPMATILTCSDSRVPAELVFDQGIGDLFVVRVAGNVVTASQLGSIEFAAQQFGTPLVVVLGHTGCGAIQATIQAMQSGDNSASANLMSIVECIAPAISPLIESPLKEDANALEAACIRANIANTATRMCQDSDILANLVKQGKLLVVGAEYSLETGEVTFFDGMPTSG